MSYRTDPDLEFLQYADNDDLRLLADVLVYKNADDMKIKVTRMTATLQLDEDYDRCYPHNMRKLWKPIAEELQKFGGHTGVNLLFRWNQGVLYREILKDVCEKQKVKGVDFWNDPIHIIENAFLERVVIMALEKMSESDRRQLVEGLKNVRSFREQLQSKVFSKDSLLGLVKIAFKQGGFQSYVLTLQVVNGISRAVVGRGLSLGANAALMKYVGSFMSGPLGWAFAVVTTVWGFMGPNEGVCLKAVAIVAYMRKKKLLNS
ncbi:DUF3944 domain-containing protein [Parabacteroides distasonis]|nr:DUF3944 domain-containing protein [Parabacteroides distasonis]